MKSTTERDYYTVAEAAELLDVSHSTVWRWIRAGTLPAYRVGSRNLRIRRRDINNLRGPEPEDHEWANLSLEERRQLLLRPLSDEERRQQRELFDEVVRNRKRYNIAPMTTDELVRRSRDKEFWYEPDG